MTSEQDVTALTSPLEAYIARSMREQPPLLADAHPDALAKQRQDFTLEYEDKRRRGWLPRELVRGYLDRQCIDGEPVFRPPAPTISAALQERSSRALQLLYDAFGSRAKYAINAIQYGKLEAGSVGNWSADPRQIEAACEEAKVAVRQYERERAEKANAENAKVVVNVLRRFESSPIGPYQHWAPGEYRLTADEFEQLEAWRDRQEAYARGRSREQPEGWGREHLVWPPFQRVEPAPN